VSMPVIDFNPRLPAIRNEYGKADARIPDFIQSAEGGRGETKIPQKEREVWE